MPSSPWFIWAPRNLSLIKKGQVKEHLRQNTTNFHFRAQTNKTNWFSYHRLINIFRPTLLSPSLKSRKHSQIPENAVRGRGRNIALFNWNESNKSFRITCLIESKICHQNWSKRSEQLSKFLTKTKVWENEMIGINLPIKFLS